MLRVCFSMREKTLIRRKLRPAYTLQYFACGCRAVCFKQTLQGVSGSFSHIPQASQMATLYHATPAHPHECRYRTVNLHVHKQVSL